MMMMKWSKVLTAAHLLLFLIIAVQGLKKDKSVVVFSKRERIEQNHVWKVMRKHCFGCWSGAMRYYVLNDNDTLDDSNNNSVLKLKDPQTAATQQHDDVLNFRLHAKATTSRIRIPWCTTPKKGTWTVWNLIKQGDEMVVPLQQRPSTRPTQLKIGFSLRECGVVLRLPFAWDQVPRLAVELGYWDSKKDGDGTIGMRRTVVAEYSIPNEYCFQEMAIVQMKAKRRSTFIGNVNVQKDTAVLPLSPPWNVTDLLDMEKLEPIQSETVHLPTMKRSVVKCRGDDDDDDDDDVTHEKAMDVLKSLLLSSSSSSSSSSNNSNNANNNSTTHITEVVTNGLCISIPKQMVSDDVNRMIFAHKRKEKKKGRLLFQALVIEFDPKTNQANTVTMHSYKQV